MIAADTLAWAAVLCSAGCVGATAWLVASAALRARELHRAALERTVVLEADSALIRSFLPVARGLGSVLRITLGRGKRDAVFSHLHDAIGRTLAAAGRPQGLNADEFFGFGVLAAAAGGFFGAFVFVLLSPDAVFNLEVWFGAGALGGALAWKSWLSNRREAWQTSIRRSLPFALDLLTLSVEAGLDFTAALQRIVRKIQGSPLGREMALLLHEIQLGKSRTQALRDLSRRVNVAELGSVVASLVQADELGSPLGPILRIQAAQQRERRSQRAEELAMKAPVKMLAPLVICFFPTVVLILAGPILMQALPGLESM